MKRINKSIFEGGFFLSDKIQVGSLETGAIQHGGCTKIDGKCYSNIDNGEYMTIYENKKNTNNNRNNFFFSSAWQLYAN